MAAPATGVEVDPDDIAACIGTKEFVASTPQYLRLRTPERDTVLYPAVSYPTYEMGAVLAGCRAVPYRTLDDIEDGDARTGPVPVGQQPEQPHRPSRRPRRRRHWGRTRRIPVLSDECYAEFTWSGPPTTILDQGVDGVLAVHSLSKRSNLAGVRAGFFAGDGDLVHYLREVRKHAGFMVPGPVQAAAVAAYADDEHVDAQRERYRSRLERLRRILREGLDVDAPMPDGAFYLWAPAPGADAWVAGEASRHRGGRGREPR